MRITCPDFKHNERVPEKYTCVGDNISPPLRFEDIPRNTESLVLLMEDPDAPGKTFTHWLVYDIPPMTVSVPADVAPPGAAGVNDFGSLNYGGPCPPSGTHHFHLRLFALDTRLNEPEGLRREMVLERIKGHVLDQAELIGLFSKE